VEFGSWSAVKMTAPAGPCEWCGGPQKWTFIAGEMYVLCVGGCLGLVFEGLLPPSVSEEAMRCYADPKKSRSGTILGEGGSSTCEGGDATDSSMKRLEEKSELPF